MGKREFSFRRKRAVEVLGAQAGAAGNRPSRQKKPSKIADKPTSKKRGLGLFLLSALVVFLIGGGITEVFFRLSSGEGFISWLKNTFFSSTVLPEYVDEIPLYDKWGFANYPNGEVILCLVNDYSDSRTKVQQAMMDSLIASTDQDYGTNIRLGVEPWQLGTIARQVGGPAFPGPHRAILMRNWKNAEAIPADMQKYTDYVDLLSQITENATAHVADGRVVQINVYTDLIYDPAPEHTLLSRSSQLRQMRADLNRIKEAGRENQVNYDFYTDEENLDGESFIRELMQEYPNLEFHVISNPAEIVEESKRQMIALTGTYSFLGVPNNLILGDAGVIQIADIPIAVTGQEHGNFVPALTWYPQEVAGKKVPFEIVDVLGPDGISLRVEGNVYAIPSYTKSTYIARRIKGVFYKPGMHHMAITLTPDASNSILLRQVGERHVPFSVQKNSFFGTYWYLLILIPVVAMWRFLRSRKKKRLENREKFAQQEKEQKGAKEYQKEVASRTLRGVVTTPSGREIDFSDKRVNEPGCVYADDDTSELDPLFTFSRPGDGNTEMTVHIDGCSLMPILTRSENATQLILVDKEETFVIGENVQRLEIFVEYDSARDSGYVSSEDVQASTKGQKMSFDDIVSSIVITNEARDTKTTIQYTYYTRRTE